MVSLIYGGVCYASLGGMLASLLVPPRAPWRSWAAVVLGWGPVAVALALALAADLLWQGWRRVRRRV
jgi:hypothetical protein